MKRVSLIAILFLAFVVGAPAVLAQGQEKEEANGKAGGEETPDVRAVGDVTMAHDLARYGYRTASPQALLTAAQILSDAGAQTIERPKDSEGDAAAEADGAKDEDISFAVDDLLAAARRLAQGDEHTLAIISDLERRTGEERGRREGPIVHYDRILARGTDWFGRQDLVFVGGEPARIGVRGDGDTDLDCWVYDENDRLIDSDTRYVDECILSWQPRWTGPFKLRIQNLGGVYNNYVLVTN